jgi:3-hydroxybutyryl-CoA dehydratase
MRWSEGDTASHTMTITSTANAIFAELCGDKNPVHFSEERMARTHFGKPIANGIQTLSCIGTAIVKLFASDRTFPVAIEQHNSFLKPVYIDDTITASVSVINNPNGTPLKKNEYWLQCTVMNQDNVTVLSATFRIRVIHE